METRTKICLGAGNAILNPSVYINHDLTKHRKEIEIFVDLNLQNWRGAFTMQYKGVEFTEIVANDLIEHLDDTINFMNNCWYLLKKGGRLKLKACGWQNPNYYIDVTHKRGFNIRSFDYFDSSTSLGKIYSYYTDLKWKIIFTKYDRKENVVAELETIK